MFAGLGSAKPDSCSKLVISRVRALITLLITYLLSLQVGVPGSGFRVSKTPT